MRALESLDAELLTLALRARIGVVQKPDEKEGWSPPESSQTLEGQFYYWALADGDDIADVTEHLRALFEEAYWSYFRLMHAVQWELDSDSEEWALRWRTGRLEDLGFPTWDDAMRVYRFLEPPARRALPSEALAPLVEWPLPVWLPSLPETGGPGDRVFRAIARARRDRSGARASTRSSRSPTGSRWPIGSRSATPSRRPPRSPRRRASRARGSPISPPSTGCATWSCCAA